MSGHQHEACRPPRLLLRRWRNRPWICSCGQAWRTRLGCSMGGCVWLWERWPETPRPADPLGDRDLDHLTYLGLCEAAFAAHSEGLGPTDAVATWVDDVGRDFGYQPTDTWPIWLVAHLTPSVRNTEPRNPLETPAAWEQMD